MKYQSTKTYGHERGLSCCFRQPLARSHCNMLHGYALSFKFTFGTDTLDDRNWVMDFGALKLLEERLRFLFDHTLVVSFEDPERGRLVQLGNFGIADVHVVDRVGCESFAEIAFGMAQEFIASQGLNDRVKVVNCECAEHGANSAIYYGDN